MPKATHQSKQIPLEFIPDTARAIDAILPVYVERNPRDGKLFFRLSPGSRKRPLPRDPTSAEFNRAYHAALKDVGEQNDLDDWTELEVLYAAQRLAKFRRIAIKGLASLLVQDRRACGERR
jgi:hypothetical protein